MKKKNAIAGGLVLVILLAMFHVVAFVVPHVYTGAYWTGYSFTTAAFLLQILFAFLAFGKADTPHRTFLGIPVFRLGIVYLLLQTVFGLVCMFAVSVPVWTAIVVSTILLGVYLILIVAAATARDTVENTGGKVKAQTAFIRSLTADMQGLVSAAKSETIRAEVKKVYEAARYSDPVSGSALAEIDGQIARQAEMLAAAVKADDETSVKSAAEEMLSLIDDRNRKCKLMK